jgi:hypothetical protein
VWAQAQAAVKVITGILQTWKSLAAVSAAFRVEPQYRLLLIADVPPATFISDQLNRADLRAWDVVRTGHRLALADTSTLQTRIAAVQAEQDRRQAEGRRRVRWRPSAYVWRRYAVMLRVCLECGDLTETTRCPACQATRDQRVNAQRGGAQARGYTRIHGSGCPLASHVSDPPARCAARPST